MMDTALEQALLAVLADGAAHTERELVERLSAEPATLAQAVRALRDLGLEPRALPGDGYRLAEPLELLDRQRIAAGLSDETRIRLSRLEVYPLLDSTNTYLLARAGEEWPGGAVCLAERQQAGRGRLGRSWGCPAVRTAVAQPMIDTLKMGQFIYAYGPGTAKLSSCKTENLSLASVSSTHRSNKG